MLKTIAFFAGLCLAVPISGQKQFQHNGAPLNCVLNEKRANPLNPYTFYHCRAEGPTLLKCPDGMVFDSVKLDCVKNIMHHMNNSTAGKAPGSSQGGSPPSMMGLGWTTPVCPPTDPQDGYPTYFPFPGDCGKFYECTWGVPKEFDCPDGLHFNPSLNVCDWPANAGCSGKKAAKEAEDAKDANDAGPKNLI